ncbi:acyl-CoA dehydrogenase family protein [Pandoraea apista]|uniref:acyl-CoA dehydrogenase family protein n=1 Tax=Pandoraea apista TaxID=93218 RepID=UPI00248DFBC8|nr:acyl-CoA dehydrogenase family protein [Pandoraea apista]
MNANNSAVIPSAKQLIERAKELIPLLQVEGPKHDENKRISDDVAMKLRDAGLFRICQPAENGGYGMRPSVLWRATREIARGDSATAWILSLAGLHPWMAGMFAPKAQDDVFKGGKDAVVLSLTGNVGRGVVATLDGDNFVLTGKWTYASGIDVADWACILVDVPKVDETRELRLLLVPKSSFRIDHESWNVFGMKGTGSKDVYLDGELVPSYRTLLWSDVQQLTVPGKERNTGPMYRIPHTSLFVMSVAAAIVSVATGLLDQYRETVRKRIPAGLNVPQTEDRFSIAELGKAAVKIEAAFNLLIRDVDEMWDKAEGGEAFSVEERARYRTDGALVCDMALAAADDLVRNLGGSLMPIGPVERYFRDLHSMASHFLMQVTPSAELYGRTLLGMPLPANARV